MAEERLRLYLDTSVFGGCCDVEFEVASNRLIGLIRAGRHIGLISDIVINEIQRAPMQVQDVLASLPRENVESVALSQEAIDLRDAYLAAGVLSVRWTDDASHVAIATVARVDGLVSWNFRHLVRLDKIKIFNQINFQNHYGFLQIISPLEVITDEAAP